MILDESSKEDMKYDLEILMPVHNEGDAIESNLREIYSEISPRVPFRFIICEDGSDDNTKEILSKLLKNLPITLLTGDERKGYSLAVKEGMKSLESPFLLCLDSDGQCDPRDFWKFWQLKEKYDAVVGWRVRRADKFLRRVMSRLFYVYYQILFRVPLHDPSCPFVLVKKKVVDEILSELGEMRVGFWWEFNARLRRYGYRIGEVPVAHRFRTSGDTKVYKLTKMPGIAFKEFIALFKVWFKTLNL